MLSWFCWLGLDLCFELCFLDLFRDWYNIEFLGILLVSVWVCCGVWFDWLCFGCFRLYFWCVWDLALTFGCI